jgi:hypothetical protein
MRTIFLRLQTPLVDGVWQLIIYFRVPKTGGARESGVKNFDNQNKVTNLSSR